MASPPRDPCLTFPGRILLAALYLALILSGCQRDGEPSSSLVRDSAGITIVENRTPSWGEGEGWTVADTPSLDIGVLDGPQEYQFFELAGAVRLADGRIAAANAGSGEIRFFDEEGRFLDAVGRQGSGPGEYEEIMWLERTRGDSLLVYDWQNRRVSVLSSEGAIGRAFELTVLTTSGGFPVVADPFPNGDLLLAADMFLNRDASIEGAQRDSALYFVIHPDGTSWDTLGAYPGGESYQTSDGENWVGGGLVFGRFGYGAVAGDGFYYGSSDRYEIEYRDSSGQIRRLIRLPHENLPVTQEDIDRYVEDRLAGARDERRRQIYRTMFERMPFPATMPAYGDFMVDLEGNLWVGETRRPGDDQPRWRIFDPEGTYLGKVDTPKNLRIFEIGSDYVLGRGRDEMEVDHLRMYPLRKSS